MRDGSYRTLEEIESWRSRDPIQMLRATLLAEDSASEDELNGIDADVQALIADAYEFAKNSPYPDPASASEHIYSAA
jgi:pyruvate dehydrogenase E1 component alpha subunit